MSGIAVISMRIYLRIHGLERQSAFHVGSLLFRHLWLNNRYTLCLKKRANFKKV